MRSRSPVFLVLPAPLFGARFCTAVASTDWGAIMAWVLVKSAFALLDLPVRTLAALYSSDFELHGLSLGIVFILVLCGPGLGLIGSWLAIEYYLRKTKLSPA